MLAGTQAEGAIGMIELTDTLTALICTGIVFVAVLAMWRMW